LHQTEEEFKFSIPKEKGYGKMGCGAFLLKIEGNIRLRNNRFIGIKAMRRSFGIDEAIGCKCQVPTIYFKEGFLIFSKD
jgi:hypothetical protein